MDFIIPTQDELRLGLRALKTVALADGEIHEAELALLEAARAMFGGAFSIDELEPIRFDALAKQLRPDLLRQLFGGVLAVCMADAELNEDEAKVVRDYAAACGIEEGAVASIRRIAKGEFRQARLDIIRRHWTPEKLRELAKDQEASVHLKAVVGMLNLRDDPALTKRYLNLQGCPNGSLGRAYFEYMSQNEFPFPGERGAPPEAMLFHDMTHILSGYGTDPRSELLTASFGAGYSDRSALSWLVFVLSQFQTGLQASPQVAAPTGIEVQPRELLAALRRGAAMNVDLNVGWSYWDVIDEPVEALRERYNILPHEHYLSD